MTVYPSGCFFVTQLTSMSRLQRSPTTCQLSLSPGATSWKRPKFRKGSWVEGCLAKENQREPNNMHQPSICVVYPVSVMPMSWFSHVFVMFFRSEANPLHEGVANPLPEDFRCCSSVLMRLPVLCKPASQSYMRICWKTLSILPARICPTFLPGLLHTCHLIFKSYRCPKVPGSFFVGHAWSQAVWLGFL